MNPDDITTQRDVDHLMRKARARNITMTETPAGQEYVVHFDHAGFSWRFEAKYQGGTFVHYRNNNGEWEEVWSS